MKLNPVNFSYIVHYTSSILTVYRCMNIYFFRFIDRCYSVFYHDGIVYILVGSYDFTWYLLRALTFVKVYLIYQL